jgi:hypothetical protein
MQTIYFLICGAWRTARARLLTAVYAAADTEASHQGFYRMTKTGKGWRWKRRYGTE